MAKTKSSRQVRYLMSGGSPLSQSQKDKLKSELRSGDVKVKRSKQVAALKRTMKKA